MKLETWMRSNCKFAQDQLSQPQDPTQFAELVNQAWEYFAREEQYQMDRLEVRRIPMDTWFHQDQKTLEAAEASGNVQTVAAILEKYRKMDEAAKATPLA